MKLRNRHKVKRNQRFGFYLKPHYLNGFTNPVAKAYHKYRAYESSEIGQREENRKILTNLAIDVLSKFCDCYFIGSIGDFIKIEDSEEWQR